MGFGEAIATGFRKYARARGRAARSEFWYWTLFSMLAGLAANIADGIVTSAMHATDYGILSSLVNLVLLLPGLAVTIRRLHDTDHSGWWMLLPITIIGIIPYVIFLCRAGTPGANRFGLGASGDIAGVFGDGPVAPTLRDQRI